MALTRTQIITIQQYRDRCYIMAILAQETASFYSILRASINLPIIIVSSIMTVMNSSFNPEEIRIPNIILNASTSLILSLMNNLKLSEKASSFRNSNNKFTKLLHFIEDKLVNEYDTVDKEDIKMIIEQYDQILENIEFEFPNHIKNKIRKRYMNKKTLPNILNCDLSFVEKIEEKENNLIECSIQSK